MGGKQSNGTKTYLSHLAERQTKQRDKKNKDIASFNKPITFLFKSLLRRFACQQDVFVSYDSFSRAKNQLDT